MSHAALLKSRLPPVVTRSSSLVCYPACMFGVPSSDSGDFDPEKELKSGEESSRPRDVAQQHQVTVTNATSTTDDYPHVEVNEAWGSPVSGCPTAAQPMPTKKRGSRRTTCKNVYKHVPHKDKPPHLVARRNARERRRVQAVNSAFARLRRCVPVENRSKRLSKVKTLHKAIEYIDHLQSLLEEADAQIQTKSIDYATHQELLGKKENTDGQLPWASNIEMACRQDDFETFASFYEGYIDYQN